MNGTPLHADGTEGVANQIIMPENEYKFENMERMFGKSVLGVQMIAINDFDRAPEFYYLDNVAVNFLEGYDVSFLTVPTGSEEMYYCITSSDLMENYDIVLGDTIRFHRLQRIAENPVMVIHWISTICWLSAAMSSRAAWRPSTCRCLSCLTQALFGMWGSALMKK